MRPIDVLLSCLCGSAFAVSLVFARPSPPVGRRPMRISPAFTRAVHFRFIVSRETNRTEHDSAGVANFPSEQSVLSEKLVALLDGEQHIYSPSRRGVLRRERLGWSDPRFTLATEPCAKVGSLQPIPVFCQCPKSTDAGNATSMRPTMSVHRRGERNGEPQREPCLSCSVHLSAPERPLNLIRIFAPLSLQRPHK